MKTLFIVILSILCTCTLPTTVRSQVTQVDCWIPWDCEGTASERPLNVGDRHIIMQFQPPWTEGERMVSYSFTTMGGTQWFPYGTIGPEAHLLDITYDDPWPSIYYEHSFLALRFIDPVGGDTIVSTPLGVTTEPAPIVSITATQNSEDSVTLTIDSETLGGGWGAPPACANLPSVMDVSGISTLGDEVFDTTFVCIPGVATHATLGFSYNGDPTEICFEVAMKRIDSSATPVFYPRVIAYSNLSCVTLGEISTNTPDLSEATPILGLYPNPCNESVSIRSNDSWEIRAMDGRLVQHGKGPETISTGTWSPGTYLVRSGVTTQKLLRE